MCQQCGGAIRTAPELCSFQSLLHCFEAFLDERNVLDHHRDVPLCVLMNVLLDEMHLPTSRCRSKLSDCTDNELSTALHM